MEFIKLNNLSVSDNKASASLMRLHAKIEVLNNKDYIYYRLIVTDSNMENIEMVFYTLEDVLSFTQNEVSKCWSIGEAKTKYQQMFDNGDFRLPRGMRPPKKNKITLSPDEVNQALINYFADGKKYKISIKEELYIDLNKETQVGFYLTEHLDYDGIKKDIEYMLTKSDIEHALKEYVNDYGYDLDSFKYLGIDNNDKSNEIKSHYEGIELIVKKKINEKQLIKK